MKTRGYVSLGFFLWLALSFGLANSEHKEVIQKEFDLPPPVAEAIDQAVHKCGPIYMELVQMDRREGVLYAIVKLLVKGEHMGIAIHEIKEGDLGRLEAVSLDIPSCASLRWKRPAITGDGISIKRAF